MAELDPLSYAAMESPRTVRSSLACSAALVVLVLFTGCHSPAEPSGDGDLGNFSPRAHEQWVAEVTSSGALLKKTMSSRVGVLGLGETPGSGPRLICLWRGELTWDPLDSDSKFLALEPLEFLSEDGRPSEGRSSTRLHPDLAVLDSRLRALALVGTYAVFLVDINPDGSASTLWKSGEKHPSKTPPLVHCGASHFSVAYAHRKGIQLVRIGREGTAEIMVPGWKPVSILSDGQAILTTDWSPNSGTAVFLTNLPAPGQSKGKLRELQVWPKAMYSTLVTAELPEGGFWLIAELPENRTLFQRYRRDATLVSEKVESGMVPVKSTGGIALHRVEGHELLEARFVGSQVVLTTLVRLGSSWSLLEEVFFLPSGRTFLLGDSR